MEKRCESCSMPMKKKEDFGGGDENNKYCAYCTDEQGKLKSYDEVFGGMVAFAQKTAGMSEEMAKEAVAKNMAQMPAWKDRA